MNKRRRSRNTPSAGPALHPGSDYLPECLMRSTVYRKVPIGVRVRLQKAILLQSAGTGALQAIEERFRLGERFGVSPGALRDFARRLEQLVRPVLSSHIVAGVLGCLPAAYRREVAAGSHVLLISQLVQALQQAPGRHLPVADLGKVASAMTAACRHNRSAPATRRARLPHRQKTSMGREQFAEAVRELYGIRMRVESR